jgi:Ca2+-binding EF-hand superfamily protein
MILFSNKYLHFLLIHASDKNNYVDKNEMQTVLEALFCIAGLPTVEEDKSIAKKKSESIIKRLDKNGDNVLDINEFLEGCFNEANIKAILIDPMFNC